MAARNGGRGSNTIVPESASSLVNSCVGCAIISVAESSHYMEDMIYEIVHKIVNAVSVAL